MRVMHLKTGVVAPVCGAANVQPRDMTFHTKAVTCQECKTKWGVTEMNGTLKGVPINHTCVIFDIDGTLLDNSHRAHLVQKEPRDWATYNSLMHLDTPHAQMVLLAKILRSHHAIILCTGREEKDRPITTESLRVNDIWHDGLYMRRTGDFRDDTIVKQELLGEIIANGFHPQFVVEDRAKVVKMWRAHGLVCLQCADGDF